MLVGARRDLETAFTGKKPETRQKARIRLGAMFIPAGKQAARFMGGRVFPEQKQPQEETPRFTGRAFTPKFRSKFKSKFRRKFRSRF